MSRFSGIPAGKIEATAVPNVLFTELFPAIDSLAELRVILHILYLVQRKKGGPRFVTEAELRADRTLMAALDKDAAAAEKALAQALESASGRGSLLHRHVEGQETYFVNSEEGRRFLAAVERGESTMKVEPAPPPAGATRPNVFELYERNLGPLTPMLAEELKEAEQEYPYDWIVDAFRIAVENNVRKWSYVRAILLDWTREGKNETTGRNTKKGRTWYTPQDGKFFKR